MNSEIKRVINKVTTVQKRLQDTLMSQDWAEEARTYAEKQRKEVQKLLSEDGAKVRQFIERERKELERFQKQIPREITKFRDLFIAQRKELQGLLSAAIKAQAAPAKRTAGKKTATKTAAKKRSAPKARAKTAKTPKSTKSEQA